MTDKPKTGADAHEAIQVKQGLPEELQVARAREELFEIGLEDAVRLATLKAEQEVAAFARKLETLNRHPERWAILLLAVESWPLTDTGLVGDASLVAFANRVLRITQDAMVDFGFDDVAIGQARKLLAARESEAAE